MKLLKHAVLAVAIVAIPVALSSCGTGAAPKQVCRYTDNRVVKDDNIINRGLIRDYSSRDEAKKACMDSFRTPSRSGEPLSTVCEQLLSDGNLQCN